MNQFVYYQYYFVIAGGRERVALNKRMLTPALKDFKYAPCNLDPITWTFSSDER